MPLAKMHSFLKYANIFYMAVGMEPYERASRPNGLIISIWFWFANINLTTILFGEMLYVLLAFVNGEHIIEAIMVMSYIGFVTVGISKMSFVWWKKAAVSRLILELEKLFPRGKAMQDAYRLDQYLRSSSRIGITFASLYTVLIWTYNLFDIMQYVVYDWWLGSRVVGLTLPYLVYTPWRYEDNWSYYVLLVLENIAGITSAAGQISTDLLFCAVATLIIMHFDYLARMIENHELSGNWTQDSRFLTNVVSYHESLLNLSADVNDIFGVPLLLNLLISTFVLCFVGFQMTIGVPVDVMIKLFLFLISSLCQIYLICYHGQMIADASFNISMAAYKQNWSHADERYRRALILIIGRSQKPVYLKATVFVNISRATMTELLQVSYKFFALLRTMYAK